MGVILALALVLPLQDLSCEAAPGITAVYRTAKQDQPKPPDTLETLKARFESEASEQPAKRYATISRIGALRTPQAADFLIQLFDAGGEAAIRSYALSALGTCGTPGALTKLREVVADGRQETNFRSSALTALASTKSDEAFALVEGFAKDEDAQNRLRISACAALQQFPLQKTEKFWRKALDDPNATIVAYALRALAPLKDPNALDRAKRILESPFPTTFSKTAAIDVWKAAGGVEMVRVLLFAGTAAEGTLRRQLADALAAVTADAEFDLICTAGLRDWSPAVRMLAARALGRIRHPRAFEALEGALKDRDSEVRTQVIESIAERRDAKSEDLLRREAQKADEDNATAALAALGRYTSKETLDLLIKYAGRAKVGPAAAAIEALGAQGRVDALPTLEKTARAKDWVIRSATIRALSKMKLKEAVDILIERLGKEEGRLLADVGTALTNLTGKALGYEQRHWKGWWDVKRDTFVFPDTKEGIAAAGGGTTTTYHGVPVFSKRIIFLLDISGSMSAKDAEGTTRLDQAKAELERVLKSLAKDTWVNMIFFDDRFDSWQKQLVPLGANFNGAIQTVRALKPRGGTNIFDPLELALQDSEADTVFLLSDGSPGSGRFTETEEVLREIRKINRVRQVAINTISLGASPLMKSLAEQNGGTHVEKK